MPVDYGTAPPFFASNPKTRTTYISLNWLYIKTFLLLFFFQGTPLRTYWKQKKSYGSAVFSTVHMACRSRCTAGHFLTYVPMSICGAGWDFCSGLGHVDDIALYTQLGG